MDRQQRWDRYFEDCKRALRMTQPFMVSGRLTRVAGLVMAHEDLLALNEALEKLRLKDGRQADLVNLRFFAGLTNDEAAATLTCWPTIVRSSVR